MTKADAFIVQKEDGSTDIIGASILDRYSIKAEIDTNGSKQLKTDGWDYYKDALLEPLYDPLKLCELLEINSYHNNCIDVIAGDAAGIFYDFVPANNTETTEEPNQEVVSFFENLNPPINKTLYKANFDKRTCGYAAIEIIRENTSDSNLKNLAYVPSYTLRRASDGKRVKQKVGTKEVWFVLYGMNYNDDGEKCDVHADTGEFHPYNSLPATEKANELLWLMTHTPKSQYYGLPSYIGALGAMFGDVSRAEYNISFFKNYGVPAFAVTVTGDFEDYDVSPEDPEYDVTKTLRWKISQQLKEVMKNPHSAVTILVPSEGEEGNVEIKLTPLSVDTKEASFRLFRKDNRDEVISAHRVPPYKVGINETGALGGSNIEWATNNYKNDVVAPDRGEDEYLMTLLIKNEFHVKDWRFKIVEHDTRDYTTDLAIAKELFNMACMTPKQIIDNIGNKFGLDCPDNPFLDEYYLNGVPLNNVWNGGEIPTEAETVLDTLEEELMKEAGVLDGQLPEERPFSEDGIKSASIKKEDTSFTERVTRAFNIRKRND